MRCHICDWVDTKAYSISTVNVFSDNKGKNVFIPEGEDNPICSECYAKSKGYDTVDEILLALERQLESEENDAINEEGDTPSVS